MNIKPAILSLLLAASLNTPLAVYAQTDPQLKPAIPTANVKPPNPILHPIKWADTVPLTHPRAWRLFRTRVKPTAEFGMSVVTCIFSIAGAVRH